MGRLCCFARPLMFAMRSRFALKSCAVGVLYCFEVLWTTLLNEKMRLRQDCAHGVDARGAPGCIPAEELPR